MHFIEKGLAITFTWPNEPLLSLSKYSYKQCASNNIRNYLLLQAKLGERTNVNLL